LAFSRNLHPDLFTFDGYDFGLAAQYRVLEWDINICLQIVAGSFEGRRYLTEGFQLF